MDAIEGRGALGGRGLMPRKGMAGAGRTEQGQSGQEGLERLMEQIRLDLDIVIDQKSQAFEGVRSEVALRRVLARVHGGRQRGAWIMRTFRAMTAMGMTLWNSRAVRMLVP